MKTHLYLVSGQATPNITPTLDADIRPDRVILLVSPDMQTRADWLEQVLKATAGVKVSRWSIEHPWNIEHIRDRVLDLLVQHDDENIMLNATGGTKPMSIAAYEAFRALDKPIFYVHPEKDQIIWMHPTGQARHQLAQRIRIPHFIQAHGRRVTERGSVQVPPDYRDFAQELIQHIQYFSGALGVLNWYANTAERSLRSEVLDKQHQRFDALQDLLDRLEQIGVLQQQDQRLVFSSESARFFANGGWLEQYVFATVNSLKKQLPSIQDTAQSLSVERDPGKIPNELDVVFLADNRLHLIECKAKNFKRGDSHSGAETLYKLDSLADAIGGLQARAMLVSYKPLPDYDMQRAKDLRIKVLHGTQLQQLRSHLEQWMQPN
ncbi:MAG: DUF1887 family CARF protein [Candidatus Thiothrix sulfatifontis]|nr:MAG: DUF1887 family CARF protein [Candidatus Thiothrix sulfatifontis]